MYHLVVWKLEVTQHYCKKKKILLKLLLILKIFRHNASEHNTKKNISTQTIQIKSNEQYLFIKDHFPEINKSYEKLKKCLYPDLFGIQNNQNGKINIFISKWVYQLASFKILYFFIY